MAAPIQQLALLCHRLFSSRPPYKISKDCLAPIVKLLNEMKAEDVNFDVKEIEKRDSRLKNDKAPVTYMHLLQEEHFTMAVFIVKEGSCLPLHDHPHMHGLLKVIHGQVKVISYSDISSDLPEHHFSKEEYSQKSSKHVNLKPVIRNSDQVVTSDDPCCVLTPTDGNIHEIQPVSKVAAFLDILVPPYQDDYSCHYYKEKATSTPECDRNFRWLLEIPQPASYWCDTISYKGPRLEDR